MGLLDWFSGKPNQDRFAQLMRDAIRQLGITQSYTYDKPNFRLVAASNPEGGNMFLHNAYADYCKAGKRERNAVLLRYAHVAREISIPAEYPLAKPALMPIVRSRADAGVLELMLKLEGNDIRPGEATLNFAGDLVIAIGYDTEHSLMRLMSNQIETWGVSTAQVLAAAIDNLRDRSTDKFERLAPGSWISAWGDYYDPSRLLLSDMIRRLAVKGNPVALAPTPHHLLVTGSDDDNGLQTVARTGRELFEKETKRLSGTPFELVGNLWQVFDPDNQRGQPFDNLRKLYLAHDYQQQKSLLEKLHEKTNEDIFVGTYMLMEEKQTQRLTSMSVWSKDVNSTLPVAETLSFVIPEKEEHFLVPWNTAAAIVADQMTPQNMYPERIKVDGFPNDTQLTQLRAAAIKR